MVNDDHQCECIRRRGKNFLARKMIASNKMAIENGKESQRQNLYWPNE